jgi:uncharacterized protein (DUF1684 family)
MTLDEAIQQMTVVIAAACPSAQVTAVKVSGEEARLTVFAPAGEMQKIKDAAFQPALDLLNKDGFDIQAWVYDKDAPPLKG